MPRKSVPNATVDDRRLRVRIKFAVPPGGIRGLTQIQVWLTERFGPQGYGVHPVHWEQARDCFAVHLDDPGAVAEVTK